MKRLVLMASACLAMSACAANNVRSDAVDTGPVRSDPLPGPYPGDVAPGERCDAAALKYLEGQRISEVDTETLPQPLRVIPHGTAVTMEYREGRYNLELDRAGRVAHVFCG